MELLLFFILGMIAIRYIFPLLDQILSLALQALEVVKGKYLVRQTEYEKEIADIAIEMDKPKTNAIGFCIPTDDEKPEEDEEDDV